MTSDRPRRPPRKLIATQLAIAFSLAVFASNGVATGPGAASVSAAIPRWTGGVDLYRPGAFTTQASWLWCTAADVQIIRNIVRHAADHSRASQMRYFDDMRAHDRYRIPLSDGVDPAGWTAGLRRYVDARYRLVASSSFDAALRSAVTNLRRTNLPVAITVSRGNHAWVLTGFTATADPAVTARFRVTSVRVTGPLWGLQSRSYGYDMRPDTRLTPRQLAGFFTPWHYARVRMAWEGRWVSVQPVAAVAKPRPAATARPTPAATRPAASRSGAAPEPMSSVASSAGASAVAPSAEPSRTPADVAVAAPGSTPPSVDPALRGGPAASTGPAGLLAGLLVVGMSLALAGAIVARGLVRRRNR